MRNIFKNVRPSIFNKVWHDPKSRIADLLRGKCDGIPVNRRTKIVVAMLAVFVVATFLLFGHTCYRIGLGRAKAIEVEHIRSLELKSDDKAESLETTIPLSPQCADEAVE